LGFENPSIELDPSYYKLPKDLENMTAAQKRAIVSQIKTDLDISGNYMHPDDYLVTYKDETIFVVTKI